MGTKRYYGGSNDSYEAGTLDRWSFASNDLDFYSTNIFVKCFKCGTFFQFGGCSNCGNNTFRMSPFGQQFKSIRCERCAQEIETWTHDNCSCINPFVNTTCMKRNQRSPYVYDNPGGPSGNASSGCFIATAVYGSCDAPEVIILRQFRDNVLLQNFIGRLFVRTYYEVSPSIAISISKKYIIMKMIKVMLIEPVVNIINYFRGENKSYSTDK